MSDRIETGTWRIEDIKNTYNRMGIPHFQRGPVWNDSMAALLLESVYFGTPCGTIILWQPTDPTGQGEALRAGATMEYLIVDGQQRIRTLYHVFAEDGPNPGSEESLEPDEDDTATSAAEGGGRRVWCLNLHRIPEVAEYLAPEGMARPLFRRVRNPQEKYRGAPLNLIPLEILRRPEGKGEAELRVLLQTRDKSLPSAVEDIIGRLRLGCCDRISRMTSEPLFQVHVLAEAAGRNTPSDVVTLYNRINSAGVRVEPEERAFATLVALHPDTSKWIGDLFAAVGEEKGSTRHGLVRDDVLKRRKERNFGFKLFIRTFVQVATYYRAQSLGTNSPSFEVVNSPAFQRWLRDDPEMMGVLQARTQNVLKFVRALLGSGLMCDDLQMLPDTMSILPLFQLLIRFPKLMDDEVAKKHSRRLQNLALRLLLSPAHDLERILGLVKQVNDADQAAEAIDALDLRLLDANRLRHELPKRLKTSNSLFDRYALMMYWLLRRRGARDFSYNNFESEPKKLGELRARHRDEMSLTVDAKPEKQHIVPYSKLEALYGFAKRGRVGRHPCNNIGNLTYISRELNHFETGLGDRFVDLKKDREDNLRAHFLDDPRVREAYEKVKGLAREQPTASARDWFERFTKLRREQVAHGFASWVEELGRSLPAVERIEPEARIDMTIDDRVRKLVCPNDVKDALLECVSSGRVRQTRASRSGDDRVLAFQVEGVRKKDDKGFEMRLLGSAIIVLPREKSAVFAELRDAMKDLIKPTEDCPECHRKHTIWKIPADEVGAVIIGDFARRLKAGR
jgi:Protein of unknown function DUF262